jgi:transketolase
MVEPCCPEEVSALLGWCIEQHDGPSFLRLVSVPYRTSARLPADYQPRLGQGVTLRAGRDGVIVTAGLVMVAEALAAADILAADGVAFDVVNLPWLNRVDPAWLKALAARARVFVTLDNHYRRGGQGEMLLSALAAANLPRMPRCLSIGLDDIPPSGRNDEVLAALRLDAAGLAGRIIAFLAEGAMAE